METVTSYSSWDDALEDIERARQSADARVKPWQAKVMPGDYVLTVAEGQPVFSEVLEAYSTPDLSHYRFCRASSVWVDSELGDIHVSQFLCVLSKLEYERARANQWQLPGASSTGAA